jgi:hypothetical protein
MHLLVFLACGATPKDTAEAEGSPPAAPPLVINEFLAKNDTVNADAAGEFDDWLEIYNTGDTIVPFKDLYLTDDDAAPTKFALSADVGLDAGDWAIFWCDDNQEQGVDHTPFKIGRTSGFLGLYLVVDGFDPVMVDSVTYEGQVPDVSMARTPDGSVDWAPDTTPTPRASNGG